MGKDLGGIERALGRSFPDLAVAPVRKIETGFGSLTVETSEGVIFRIARGPVAAKGHALEAVLVPRLARRVPVALPEFRWRVEPGSPDFAYGAIGHRKLPGRRLAHADAQRVAGDLAAFLAALHAFPVEEAERLGLPRADRVRDRFEELRDRVLPVLRGALTAEEYAAVRRWSDDVLADAEIDRFAAVVRHGDLWYGNVLVDESSGRLAGVLDWGNAGLGDAAGDLARQLHLGAPFAEAVLLAYEARRPPDPRLRQRMQRRWELLEFAGIGTAVDLDDHDELEETIAKLRAGPILAR